MRTKKHGRKDLLDRFYTSDAEAKQLTDDLFSSFHKEVLYDWYFIEPSAGKGTFVSSLLNCGVDANHIFAGDIAPAIEIVENQVPILKWDFLDDISSYNIPKLREKTICIRRPPFGEPGMLCVSFLNKAKELARYTAFILPPTFLKQSYQKKVPAKLIQSWQLKDTKYSTIDGIVDVPSCFFLWDNDKPYEPPMNFIKELPFVFLPLSKKEEADFVIRRVGGTAGTASEKLEVSSQSHYFCKRKDNCRKDIVDIINSCYFPQRDWSVGPRSLSQNEIAEVIVKRLKGE